MKAILLSIILLYTITTESQTLKETQDWIKEKIELHSYSNEKDIQYEYTINFMGSILIVNEKLDTYINKLPNNLSDTYSIPIKELTKIRFEEKANNVWLFLKIKSGNNLITKSSIYGNNKDDLRKLSQFTILLEKSIKSDELINRLKKAFNHLIKLNGGVVNEEKF